MFKQNSGDKSCVAVVAAMAFGGRPKDFTKTVKHEPPYSDLEFSRYALSRGASCVFGVTSKNFFEALNVSDSVSEGEEFITKEADPEKVGGNTICRFEFRLQDFEAYIVVEGELNGESEHAIYWDGKQIWDPNPMTKNGRPLGSYKIKRYYPIFKLE